MKLCHTYDSDSRAVKKLESLHNPLLLVLSSKQNISGYLQLDVKVYGVSECLKN